MAGGAATDLANATDQRRIVTVLMTAPGADEAEALVRRLVGERLAACGNIVPGAVSVYRWEGSVQRDAEAVVVLKTTRRLVPDLLRRAEELHPYDVPELLVHEVATGSEAYLDWVRGECGSEQGGGARS